MLHTRIQNVAGANLNLHSGYPDVRFLSLSVRQVKEKNLKPDRVHHNLLITD
jgi:hypothetical protein